MIDSRAVDYEQWVADQLDQHGSRLSRWVWRHCPRKLRRDVAEKVWAAHHA